MATAGDRTYKGLAVPLWGNSNIRQNGTTTETLFTLTRSSVGAAPHLVLDSLSGAGAAGAGIVMPGNSYIKFSTPLTTRPTTGLDKGDLMLLFHGSVPKIGVCSSSAANTIKLIRLRTKTFGRLTA